MGEGGGRMAAGDTIQSKALFYFRLVGSLQNRLWKVPAKMQLRETPVGKEDNPWISTAGLMAFLFRAIKAYRCLHQNARCTEKFTIITTTTASEGSVWAMGTFALALYTSSHLMLWILFEEASILTPIFRWWNWSFRKSMSCLKSYS